MDIREVRK